MGGGQFERKLVGQHGKNCGDIEGQIGVGGGGKEVGGKIEGGGGDMKLLTSLISQL
jgi:hypothetical protein